MLEVVSTSDHVHALVRRHRSALTGRMVDTTLSRWPTKNAAHDALYAEIHGLILPHGATASAAYQDWRLHLHLQLQSKCK